MSEPLFRLFPAAPEGPVLENYPRGFTVIGGDPKCRTWRYYARQEGAALTASGLWNCTVGAFAFRYQHWEFLRVLRGVVRITPEGGAPMTLKEGDAFVAEPGFAGTWEVIETMDKHFVTRFVQP